jgi:hypothetical protein
MRMQVCALLGNNGEDFIICVHSFIVLHFVGDPLLSMHITKRNNKIQK